MIKQLRIFSAVLLLLVGYSAMSFAQTCSVNSGVDKTICSKGTKMTLSGNSTGSITTAAKWAFVSGPNVPTIVNPSSANTTVTGFIAGVYKFRYYATCSDAATASDTVTITVQAAPVFTAGPDAFVCGNSATLNATLPGGASGLWSYRNVSNVPGGTFSGSTSPTGTVNIPAGLNGLCPKRANVIWRVTQGVCVLRDTAVITFGGESTSPAVLDTTICGNYYVSPTYSHGCGGSMTATEISGPTAATINYTYGAGSATNNATTSVTFGGLIIGTYTFATQVVGCSGSIFRDTFVVTVASTVFVTNPTVNNIDVCQPAFQPEYYLTPTVTLLPGETMTWNTTVAGKNPAALPSPTASVVSGNALKITSVTHPDSFATQGYFQYRYEYTVNNGTCSRTFSAYLTLRTPPKKAVFKDVINLPCGIDSADITQLISGTPGIAYDLGTLVSKPAGAADPFIGGSSANIRVYDLEPGKYVFSFRYNVGACEYLTKTVEVYVSKPTGLSNAGTDQLLPCGVTSTTLAGNFPDPGESGIWQQVSGPSAVALTPTAPSFFISGLAVGTYTFRWAIIAGTTCPGNYDDVNVVVFATTPIANAGPDATVCAGNVVPLNGSLATRPGVTTSWTQIGGPSVTIADPAASVTSFSGTIPSTVYTFVYTMSNVCGSTTDTVVITTNATTGPSAANITTANTCLTSTTTLTLNASAVTVGTGTWSVFSGGSVSFATATSNPTTATFTTAGTYKILWTVSAGGCDSQTDTVIVSYRPTALTSNAGLDQNICGTVPSNTVTMAATAPSGAGIIGTWTQFGGAGTTITSPTSATSTITGLAPGGTYDYIWTVSAGAESVCPVARDTVRVIVSTPPSAAVAMADVINCATSAIPAQAITATAPISGIGAWSILQTPVGFITTIANPALNNTTASIGAGITKLLWTVVGDGGACPATTDTVTFETVPTVNAGADQNICNASVVNLVGTANGTGTVLWTQTSGPTVASFTSATNRITTATNLAAGVYVFKYTLTHPTCGGSDEVTITNYGLPVAKAGTDFTLCWVPPSATFSLSADTVGAINPATVTWSRTLGAGTVSFSASATIVNPSVTVTANGSHQFLLTVANPGCTSRDYIDVFVDRPTVLGFTLTPRSACNDSFAITASVPVSGYTYLWEFPTGLIPTATGTDLRGPIANRFLTKGNNKVYLTLTDPVSGCTAKDSTTIFVCKSVIPPIANNIISDPMNSSNGHTAIPQLKASNPSGTDIRDYQVLTLPPASEGILYYCPTAPAVCATGSLAPVTTSATLTPAQSASLYFDPAQTFTGNVQFTYQATDTNDLVSNIATYTIPVFNNPPITQNIRTAVLVNTSNDIFIPRLISGDADGTVDSFYVSAIPSSSLGVLKYCSNGTDPCTGTLISVTGDVTLTPAQAKTLVFDPNPAYVGDFVFEYQTIDNNGNLSNISTYTIPVVDLYTIFLPPVNLPPVTNNIIAENINNTSGPTPVPNLRGTDPDGTVANYTIGSTVPDPLTEGTLYYCAAAPASCTVGTLTAVTPGLTLTPAQAMSLQFDPVSSFIGVAQFTYFATDNDGVPLSSVPSTYKIPVVNQPPVANPASVTPISNTRTTPTLLPPLTGYDIDGTVITYNIVDVPEPSQGTLKYCATAPGIPCTAATLTTITAALTDLTPAQIATLHFIPSPTFTGNYVFHFTTIDNNGLESQPAAFTIPVIVFDLITGEPPIAISFNNPTIKSTSTALLSTALTGSDPDGTVVSYTVTSVTPANEGILTYCTTPPTGCGTTLLPNTTLTPAQAATILFTPNANFTGVATFNYVDTDDDGNISNTATVTIPVVNDPPVSLNINNAPISRSGGLPTTLNPLSSTDPDGTVVSYKIITVPTPEEGELKLCVTPPSTGCTAVLPGQVLTPAEMAKLTFTSNPWNHSPVVTFLYATTDNSGNISNMAMVNIPLFDAAPLPVELISFTATKQGNNANIKWVSGTQNSNVTYQLQHSIDAQNWVMINSQKSKSTQDNSYEYLHTNVAKGNNYYRLKIVDLNNDFKYGPVRVLSFDNATSYSILVHPNPVTENLTISTSDGTSMSQVMIFSNEGKKIQEFNDVNSGTTINMNNYASGFYLIKIKDKNGEMQVIKLSKK